MGAAIAIALKDLRVFLENGRAVALALVLPALLALSIGGLRTSPTSFRVLLVGTTDAPAAEIDAMAELLRESSLFTVETTTAESASPFDLLRTRDIDLLCTFGDEGRTAAYSAITDPFKAALLARAMTDVRTVRRRVGQWTASLTAARVATGEVAQQLRQLDTRPAQPSTASLSQSPAPLAQSPVPVQSSPSPHLPPECAPPPAAVPAGSGPRASLAAIDAALGCVPKDLADSAWRSKVESLVQTARGLPDAGGGVVLPDQLMIDARALADAGDAGLALTSSPPLPSALSAIGGRVDDPPLTMLHPLALERPRALLPEVVALIVCFLPFVLSVQSLLREREERTIDILLAAPRVTPAALFAGKLVLPVGAGLLNFAVIVPLLQLVHGLYVKPGVLPMLLVLVPATIASAVLGLAVSAWVRSAAHATIACAVYFLMVALFSGFLYPISPQDVRSVGLSALSPLTYVHPPMKAWMFGAPVAWVGPFIGVLAQCAVYGAAGAIAFRRWHRRL